MKLRELCIPKDGLEQLKIILEDWIPKEASIVVAIGGSYVFLEQSTHHIHLKLREKVLPDSIAARVLETRRKTDKVVDQSIFDVPYYVVGYPLIIDELEAALVIVLPSTSYNEKQLYKFLTGRQNEDWSPVPTDQISHIESLQKRTWFYSLNEQYRTNITLKELETRLPEHFIRIHRSYILNIYYIQKIKKDLASNFIVLLKSGIELPVSQTYLSNLRSVLEF
ncbi:LytR/AlgR family response regulator transcription factor [Ureibacillus sp. NPDC094379]